MSPSRDQSTAAAAATASLLLLLLLLLLLRSSQNLAEAMQIEDELRVGEREHLHLGHQPAQSHALLLGLGLRQVSFGVNTCSFTHNYGARLHTGGRSLLGQVQALLQKHRARLHT